MVILLGHRGCPGTANARRFLTELGVIFIVRDVLKDPEAREQLLASGVPATPLIIIGNRRLTGFDSRAILEALGYRREEEGEIESASSRG